MSVTIGIDPGMTGAVAMLDSYGCLVEVADMPTIDGYVSAPLLYSVIDDMVAHDPEMVEMVVIERVASMPKQGVASTFKFGCAFGVALGVVGGMRLPSTLTRPAAWKKDMGLNSDKERSRRRAIERWPEHADLFKLKKHADRAEAALLALWWHERAERNAA